MSEAHVKVFTARAAGLDDWEQALLSSEVAATTSRFAVQSSFSPLTRPIDMTVDVYRRAGATDGTLDAIRQVLERRQYAWYERLAAFPCRDIYALGNLERYCRDRVWLGHRLERAAVAEHLTEIGHALKHFPNYEVALLEGEELYFNYVITGGCVLLNGGCEVDRQPIERIVGGLQITDNDVVNQFQLDFERLWRAARIKEKHDVRVWLDLRVAELLEPVRT